VSIHTQIDLILTSIVKLWLLLHSPTQEKAIKTAGVNQVRQSN